MIYFTSDLHLGHERSIEFNNRPFSNVDDMNETLIRNINEIVGSKDELWVLGDFTYKVDREKVRDLRNNILCKRVHLVNGNHDKDYSQDHIFQSVQHYKELKTPYGRFIFFITRFWNGMLHIIGAFICADISIQWESIIFRTCKKSTEADSLMGIPGNRKIWNCASMMWA